LESWTLTDQLYHPASASLGPAIAVEHDRHDDRDLRAIASWRSNSAPRLGPWQGHSRRDDAAVVEAIVPEHGLSGCGRAVDSRPVTSASRGPAGGSPGRCSRPPRAARRVVLVHLDTELTSRVCFRRDRASMSPAPFPQPGALRLIAVANPAAGDVSLLSRSRRSSRSVASSWKTTAGHLKRSGRVGDRTPLDEPARCLNPRTSAGVGGFPFWASESILEATRASRVLRAPQHPGSAGSDRAVE
jgi:hypothetical protein